VRSLSCAQLYLSFGCPRCRKIAGDYNFAAIYLFRHGRNFLFERGLQLPWHVCVRACAEVASMSRFLPPGALVCSITLARNRGVDLCAWLQCVCYVTSLFFCWNSLILCWLIPMFGEWQFNVLLKPQDRTWVFFQDFFLQRITFPKEDVVSSKR